MSGAADTAGRAPELISVLPALVVPDVQRTAEHYRDKLGFRLCWVLGEPPGVFGIVDLAEGQGVHLKSADPTCAQVTGRLPARRHGGEGLDIHEPRPVTRTGTWIPLACAVLLAVHGGAVAAQAGRTITAADLQQEVRSLAADAMEGRATASNGGHDAAVYLWGFLSGTGARGAAEDGGFLQLTDTRRLQSEGVPRLTLDTSAPGVAEPTFGVDFEYRSGGPLDSKLVLVVARSAADVPRVARADAALYLTAGGRQARQWLADAGAPAGRGWGLLLTQGPETPGKPGASASGLYSVAEDAPPTTFTVRGPLCDLLASGTVVGVHALLFAGSGTQPACNVVGRIDGVGTKEHPELAQEAIVFSAHYDHLGVARSAEEVATRGAGTVDASPSAPTGGSTNGTPDGPIDLIYNGADDDASGCAAVLELAQAFGHEAGMGRPPARTLIFLFVTGEEVGLLGTEYYLDHPVVPLEQTVCNLNFEMLGRPDALAGGAGRLWLTGFERSNLGPAWAAAGLPIVADARPEQHFFERSDNFAFVMRGIVGQTLSSYNLHTDYHHVSDEADTLDYVHMESAVRASMAAALMLADGSLRPAWIPVPERNTAPAPDAAGTPH